MARATTTRATPTRRRAALATPEAVIEPPEPTLAINALLGTSRAHDYPTTMPIGEEDRNIFACPVCSRPLATGARRCPGCRTRLVMGVPLRRASVFVSVGVLVGLLGGIGLTATAAAVARDPAGPSPSQPAVGASPSGGVASLPPSPTPTTRPTAPSVPPTARAALGQVGTLHVRLVESGTDLAQYLEAADIDASAVAKTLRQMLSNSAFGVDVAKRLGTWDTAAPLATDLAAFYEEIRATARGGLAASVRNDAAYRQAATKMVTLLGDLERLDADARALALTVDIDLPSLALDDLAGAPSAP